MRINHTAGTFYINLENIVLSGKADEADDQYQEINKDSLNVQLVGMETHLSFQVIKLPLSWVPDDVCLIRFRSLLHFSWLSPCPQQTVKHISVLWGDLKCISGLHSSKKSLSINTKTWWDWSKRNLLPVCCWTWQEKACLVFVLFQQKIKNLLQHIIKKCIA